MRLDRDAVSLDKVVNQCAVTIAVVSLPSSGIYFIYSRLGFCGPQDKP